MTKLTRQQRNNLKVRIACYIIEAAAFAAVFAAGKAIGGDKAAARGSDAVPPVVFSDAAYADTIQAETAKTYKEIKPAVIPASTETTTPAPYYPLTDADRDLIARVVMAEAGGEDYDGQRLVAQCILNVCLMDGISPDEAIAEYGYTSSRPDPSESVLEAVSAVFDRHDVVTPELIVWFYNPSACYSAWHESQTFVIQHGNHRFFAP